MRIRVVVFIAAIAGVLLLASGVLLGVFPTAVEPPQEVTTPPAVPAGTVYWAEVEYTFHHFFIDSQGRGAWGMWVVPTVQYGTPDTYNEHEIVVWEQDLNEGYSWNLQGSCELKGVVKVYMVRDDGAGYKDLAAWPENGQTLITFPCNQGATGDLVVRPPTFFLLEALPGEGNFRYHFDFIGTLAFRTEGYAEVDSFDATGPVLCPAGANC